MSASRLQNQSPPNPFSKPTTTSDNREAVKELKKNKEQRRSKHAHEKGMIFPSSKKRETKRRLEDAEVQESGEHGERKKRKKGKKASVGTQPTQLDPVSRSSIHGVPSSEIPSSLRKANDPRLRQKIHEQGLKLKKSASKEAKYSTREEEMVLALNEAKKEKSMSREKLAAAVKKLEAVRSAQELSTSQTGGMLLVQVASWTVHAAATHTRFIDSGATADSPSPPSEKKVKKLAKRVKRLESKLDNLRANIAYLKSQLACIRVKRAEAARKVEKRSEKVQALKIALSENGAKGVPPKKRARHEDSESIADSSTTRKKKKTVAPIPLHHLRQSLNLDPTPSISGKNIDAPAGIAKFGEMSWRHIVGTTWTSVGNLKKLGQEHGFSVATGKFSKEEVELLEQAVYSWAKAHNLSPEVGLAFACQERKVASQDTSNEVADSFLPTVALTLPLRPMTAISKRVLRIFEPGETGLWLEEHLVKLRRAVAQYGTSWRRVAKEVGRSSMDCHRRWYTFERPEHQLRTKGRWTEDEVKSLRDSVEKYGPSWTLVANRVRTRNNAQCAEKWRKSGSAQGESQRRSTSAHHGTWGN